jgi:hypothetical protein
MLSAPDLELFAVHLAIHLCGADPIRQRVSENQNTEFQLYWRSPLLQKGSTDIGGRANGARRLLFIDVTFDFGERLDGTARDCDTPEDSLIGYRFGSLWKNEASSDDIATDAAAVYYTGAPIQVAELEQHFLDASIDEASTPAPILAKSLALALQGLTATSLLDRGDHADHAHSDNATTQERVVPLYYSDVDSWADWNVGGEQSSAVSGPVFQMIVLQQQMQTTLSLIASTNETSTPLASNTNEVGEVCNLVLEKWKPAVLQELRTRRAKQPPAVEQAVPVATADVSQSVPPPTTTTTIEDDDTAAAETERTVPTASTTSQPLPTIMATAAAATESSSVRPTVPVAASGPKKVVKKKGAAHGFAKINAKKPKRGGLQFAD